MEQRPECPMEHVRAAGGVFPFGCPTSELGSCLPSPVREKVSRDATDEGVVNAAATALQLATRFGGAFEGSGDGGKRDKVLPLWSHRISWVIAARDLRQRDVAV